MASARTSFVLQTTFQRLVHQTSTPAATRSSVRHLSRTSTRSRRTKVKVKPASEVPRLTMMQGEDTSDHSAGKKKEQISEEEEEAQFQEELAKVRLQRQWGTSPFFL